MSTDWPLWPSLLAVCPVQQAEEKKGVVVFQELNELKVHELNKNIS